MVTIGDAKHPLLLGAKIEPKFFRLIMSDDPRVFLLCCLLQLVLSHFFFIIYDNECPNSLNPPDD